MIPNLRASLGGAALFFVRVCQAVPLRFANNRRIHQIAAGAGCAIENSLRRNVDEKLRHHTFPAT